VTPLSQTEPYRTRAERRAAAAAAARAQRGAAANHGQGAGAGATRPRRGGLWTWWILGAAVVIAAGGIAWWAAAGRAKVPAAPMLGQHVPNEGWEHVPVGTQIHYRANPPSSGPHYPFPAPGGVYPNGLQTGFWVHNLEHGYIAVLYRPPASPDQMATFDRMLTQFPKSKFGNVKLVIVPYSDMPHPFALLAWDWRLDMDTFKEGTALQFYKEHVDRGREDIP
jgi:Protein of unknown function (DUF3105)